MTSESENDPGTVITETIEASIQAWLVLMCAPLKIYGECLKVMGGIVSDIVDNIQTDDESAQQ